jgi:hypothetical protein
MLFLLGTAAYGAGAVAALGADAGADRPMVGRILARVTLAVGLIGALGALAGFAGFTGLPADRIAGASIGLGSALFIPISLQIAKSRTPSEP